MVKIKRAYESAVPEDGARFLIDRLWPRGVKKQALKVQDWARSVAPSKTLLTWFKHDPAKWEGFQRRYTAELDKKPETWQPLLAAACQGDITLVFGARDVEHNNAIVLRDYLKRKSRGKPK